MIQNRIQKYAPPEKKDLLATCRDAYSAQRDYMIALHAEWYVQILACHGLIASYDAYSAREVVYTTSGDYKWWLGYNLIDPIISRMKAALMQSSPKREARSMRPTEMSIEEARIATLVMDHAYERHKIEEKEQEAGDIYSKIGNVVLSFYYDRSKGEVIGVGEDGQEVRTGELCPRVDSPMRWLYDPRVSNTDDARYAMRRSVMPMEYAIERWPHMAKELEGLQTELTDDDFYELRLLNLTNGRRNVAHSLPREKRMIAIVEYYEVPCREYPKGRYGVLAGGGMYPQLVLEEYEENVYGCIPAVMGTLSKVTGRLYGESPVKFLIPGNQEINRRRRQIMRNADLIGNPVVVYPLAGGTPPQTITNKIGQILPYDGAFGPPEYMQVPLMPPFVLESERAAMQMMDLIAPVSPFDKEHASKTTSGIQLSLTEEINRRSIAPMMRNWEILWDSFWKMYLKLWRRFTIFPQQIAAVGPELQATAEYVSGDSITDNVTVRIVPSSSMPTSRTAAFAEWIELFKVGAANPMDPMTMKRFWEDIGKGDMARTWRDMQADMDLGDRNLMRIIRGEQVLPRVQDNPDVMLDKIANYMKTPEYEAWLKTDPMLEKRLTDAIFVFSLAKQQQEMALVQAMMRMGGGGGEAGGYPYQQGGVQGQAQQIGPGNPMGGKGPTQSQGFSEAANPMADQGGNPR